MPDTEVLIVGAGPTGLMLAAELALAGIEIAVVERRPDRQLSGARALGLHTRTLEILDQRGVVDRFLAAGYTAQTLGFSGAHLDISDLPTRHPYGLALMQVHIERLLAEWVAELGVHVRYACDVAGFSQNDVGVEATLSDGETLRAKFIVGCDGGRSVVRKTAGIAFPGWDPTFSAIIAEVKLADEPVWGVHRDALGTHGFGRLEDRGLVRVMVSEREIGRAGETSLGDLSAALKAAFGTDYGAHDPASIWRFTDMTRQAAAYRERRAFLAGDAAHIHAPDGGRGLQTGVQDAVNLGWKLAQVIKGVSPDALLDTYHAERHPVGARVLRDTMAAVAMRRPDDRTRAAAETVAELLKLDAPRRHMAAQLSGLAIRYDMGHGRPLLGRRMPDLDISTSGGATSVFALLRDARPLFLNLGEPGAFDTGRWSDSVQHVNATYDGLWELPAIGVVAAPHAVLVRPDGYVAWASEDGSAQGLSEALTTWFGAPAS